MTYSKPTPIRVEGINIIDQVIDEKDDVVKITLIVYNEQFSNFSKQYEDHKGISRFEIVKRKVPSKAGHGHWMRVASSQTNPCKTDGIFPKKPNELT